MRERRNLDETSCLQEGDKALEGRRWVGRFWTGLLLAGVLTTTAAAGELHGRAGQPDMSPQATAIGAFLTSDHTVSRVELDEVRIARALAAAGTAVRDAEARHKTATRTVLTDEREAGRGDARRGDIAFFRDEIDGLSRDIARAGEGFAESLREIGRRPGVCTSGPCRLPALDRDLQLEKALVVRVDEARGALEHATKAAQQASDEVRALARQHPAGQSLRSSVTERGG